MNAPIARRQTWPLPRSIRVCALVLLAFSGGDPTSSRAADGFDAAVERVWIRNDSLFVDFRIRELFSDRIRDGLARGLPMTYSLVLELWRQRVGWWDALETRDTYEFKIQRNVWDDLFILGDRQGRRLWFPDIETLERHLCERHGELVGLTHQLRPDKSYYVVLIPTLRPLTIEDIREVEAWLTGEFQTSRKRSGLSTLTHLPRMLFGVFVDFTGLGDKSILTRSGPFRFDRLPEGAETQPRGDSGSKPSG